MTKAIFTAVAALGLGACAVPGADVLESGEGRVVTRYVEPSGRPAALDGIAEYCADRGQQPVLISDVPTPGPGTHHGDWRRRTVECQTPTAES